MTIILLLLVFLFVGLRLIFFLLSPIIKKSGLVKVYNSFFFIREKRKYIEMHLGFANDFLSSENFSKRKVILCLTSGLLDLINDIEAGKIELNKKIQGNPYFFKSDNFHYFGFKARKLYCFEKLRFYLNYFELSFLKSFLSKKLVFVKIDKLKIVYTDAKTLLDNKNKILSTYLRLRKSTDLISNKNKTEVEFLSKTAV